MSRAFRALSFLPGYFIPSYFSLAILYSLAPLFSLHRYSTSVNASLNPSTVVVQPGLCGTWLETPKAGFLMAELIYLNSMY